MARRTGTGLIAGVLVLCGAGCASVSSQPGELSGRTSTSASPPSSLDESAVAEVYKKYFEIVVTMGSADEATIRAKLAPYAEGAAVENVVSTLAYFRSLNQQTAGSVVFADLDVAIDGDSATVRECHDGSTELIVDSTTGAVISFGPIQGLEAKLSRGTDEIWRMVNHDAVEGAC